MENQLTINEAIKEFSYETPMAMAKFHMRIVYYGLLKYFSENHVISVTALKTKFIFDKQSSGQAMAYLIGFISRRYPETAHFFKLHQTGLNVIEITHMT